MIILTSFNISWNVVNKKLILLLSKCNQWQLYVFFSSARITPRFTHKLFLSTYYFIPLVKTSSASASILIIHMSISASTYVRVYLHIYVYVHAYYPAQHVIDDWLPIVIRLCGWSGSHSLTIRRQLWISLLSNRSYRKSVSTRFSRSARLNATLPHRDGNLIWFKMRI